MNGDTLALIGRAHQGDKVARDTLFGENTGLIYSVARRFTGRGVELEDLIQIGSIGLLKAVDKFDLAFDVKFSTYAVPMIAGEIKRFLRDDGMIKISRSIKENQYKIYRMKETLELRFGREPTVQELSDALHMQADDLVLAMESSTEVESLYRTIYQGEGTELQLLDKIPERENRHEKMLDKILVEELLNSLGAEEKQLIQMRYFCDMTQTEVASRLGVSQVQVSRMEKRILTRLRGQCL